MIHLVWTVFWLLLALAAHLSRAPEIVVTVLVLIAGGSVVVLFDD